MHGKFSITSANHRHRLLNKERLFVYMKCFSRRRQDSLWTNVAAQVKLYCGSRRLSVLLCICNVVCEPTCCFISSELPCSLPWLLSSKPGGPQLKKLPCTAKTLYQKFETNIPRNETARSRSEFLHPCKCELFAPFHICEYINRILFAVWNYEKAKYTKRLKLAPKNPPLRQLS